jgi:hypothetical protein
MCVQRLRDPEGEREREKEEIDLYQKLSLSDCGAGKSKIRGAEMPNKLEILGQLLMLQS